jgi:hypothetical protein
MLTQLRRPPRARDLEIHRQLVEGHRSQADVAAEHGLSQSRISKIRRQVADFQALFQPADEQPVEQLAWGAHQDYLEQVRHSARCVLGWMQEKPTCGMINSYVKTCKELRDATIEAAHVSHACGQALKANPRWREDQLVADVESLCRDVREAAKAMRRGGFVPVRFPHDTRAEREAYVREAFRGLAQQEEFDALELMPPAWRRAYDLAFCLPEGIALAGTGGVGESIAASEGIAREEADRNRLPTPSGSTLKSTSSGMEPQGVGSHFASASNEDGRSAARNDSPTPTPAEKKEYRPAKSPAFSGRRAELANAVKDSVAKDFVDWTPTEKPGAARLQSEE